MEWDSGGKLKRWKESCERMDCVVFFQRGLLCTLGFGFGCRCLFWSYLPFVRVPRFL